MTDREAIEILKYERGMFPPYFDGDTEVFDAAISALQEREERSKGCEFCNIEANKNAMIEDHGYAVCPYCGRPLKGDET